MHCQLLLVESNPNNIDWIRFRSHHVRLQAQANSRPSLKSQILRHKRRILPRHLLSPSIGALFGDKKSMKSFLEENLDLVRNIKAP